MRVAVAVVCREGHGFRVVVTGEHGTGSRALGHSRIRRAVVAERSRCKRAYGAAARGIRGNNGICGAGNAWIAYVLNVAVNLQVCVLPFPSSAVSVTVFESLCPLSTVPTAGLWVTVGFVVQLSLTEETDA